MLNVGEVEEVEKHDILFEKPLRLFYGNPVNGDFVENRMCVINATPVDELARIYEFHRASNTVGLMKLSDAEMHAEMKVTGINAAMLANNGRLVTATVPKNPLRTIWSTKELKINQVSVTPVDNYTFIPTYLQLFMRQDKNRDKDNGDLALSWKDTAGHMNSIAGFDDVPNNAAILNTGGAKRNHALKQWRTVIDGIDCALVDNSKVVYLPTAFDIALKFTRCDNEVFLRGANAVGQTMAVTELRIRNLKIKIPILKTNEQLTAALNKEFIVNAKEARYYVINHRTITTPIAAGAQNFTQQDIFNGRVPTRLYIVYSPQATFNGTYAQNIFNFTLPNYDRIKISINNAVAHETASNEELYMKLRQTLGKRHSEMSITYNEFTNGYGILGFDLNTSRDSSLNVLPARPTGVVNVEMTFTQAIAVGTFVIIGEFRNELKIGINSAPRALYVS